MVVWGCACRVSATAGMIFHGTRTPLTVWFAAPWLMISQKQGISALGRIACATVGCHRTGQITLVLEQNAEIVRGWGVAAVIGAAVGGCGAG